MCREPGVQQRPSNRVIIAHGSKPLPSTPPVVGGAGPNPAKRTSNENPFARADSDRGDSTAARASRANENIASHRNGNVASGLSESSRAAISRANENIASRPNENATSRRNENVASRANANAAPRRNENVPNSRPGPV